MKPIKAIKCLGALLLCIAMVLCLVPTSANAQEALNNQTIVPLATAGVSEVLALRTQNTKHYDMGNGVFRAVVYDHPVHELDNNGNWKDIDFGLTLSGAQGNQVYHNKTAGVSFPEKITADQPIMTLTDAGTSITMFLDALGKASQDVRGSTTSISAKVTAPNSSFKTVEEAQNANFSSKILYEEILPGIDLEYIVDIGIIKENIIVKEKAPVYQFAFNINLTGLHPVMQDDGSIVIFDLKTEEQRYEIPAPIMYDANGCVSESVEYKLNKQEKIYTLTVIADTEWINSEDRRFPVTIDPSYVVSTESADDTYIDSDAPDTAQGNKTMLSVKSNRVSFIKTPVPSVPSNRELHWAALTLFYYYPSGVASSSVGITAHRVTAGSWNESTLTWNSISNLSNYGLSTSALDGKVTASSAGATITNPKQIDFVVTEAVQGWLDGKYSNYGLGLKYVSGSSGESVEFKSFEAGSTYRPRITYEYGTEAYRYISYYDSTFSSSNVNNIANATTLAEKAYQKQFGLRITAKGSPTRNTSLADACSLGANVSCTSACSYHHKDIMKISAQLYAYMQSNQHRVVYWTDRAGYVYCEHNGENCVIVDLKASGECIAVVCHGRPVIHFMNLLPDNASNAKNRACMGINLIHETAHTFGLDDRYTWYNHSNSGYQCVMEYYLTSGTYATNFYDDIMDGTKNAFCTNCASDLSELLP